MINCRPETYHFNTLLTFFDSTFFPLNLNTISLSLFKHNEQIVECRVTFKVNFELYAQIDTQALFNLKPEIRLPFKKQQFNPELDINIETTLQPNLLSLLVDKAKTPEEAAIYLINLNQEFINCSQSKTNSILNTESWLALSVKQHQPSGEIGYATFWNLLNPATLSQPDITSDRISETIVDFVKEWAATNISETTTEFLENISNIFQDLGDETASEAERSENYSLLATVVNFFEEDEWPFIQKAEQSALFLSFRGNNGQWNCYAIPKEESQQFIFYSLCPLSVPEDKRQAIAEFITRANYDMIIGNFELDFNDGNIRYKTSIDVEGFQLNSSLIKPIVYHNVMTMDRYLPGILAILEGNLSPSEAIDQIEQRC